MVAENRPDLQQTPGLVDGQLSPSVQPLMEEEHGVTPTGLDSTSQVSPPGNSSDCQIPTHTSEDVRVSGIQRAREFYFTPKRMESEKLYRALGVGVFKKYVPTSGDLVSQRYGATIMPSTGTRAERVQKLEKNMRWIEGAHIVMLTIETGLSASLIAADAPMGGIALLGGVNVLTNVYPIMLQRYNRLRLARFRNMREQRRQPNI